MATGESCGRRLCLFVCCWTLDLLMHSIVSCAPLTGTMFEGLLADVFNRFLGEYVKHDINPEHLSASIYSASLLPLASREARSNRRVGWTAYADSLLAESVRVNCFRFESVASELRAKIRDGTRPVSSSTSKLGPSGEWAPPPRLVTADECRLRWTILDRALCEAPRDIS